MKQLTWILLISALCFTSCEKAKNNRAERRLEGTWQLEKSEYGGEEVDLTGREQIMTFFDSNDKEYFEEARHRGTLFNSYEGYSYSTNFEYFVQEKGKELNLFLEFNSPQLATTYALSQITLKRLGANKMIWEGKNADGMVSKFTFKRI